MNPSKINPFRVEERLRIPLSLLFKRCGNVDKYSVSVIFLFESMRVKTVVAPRMIDECTDFAFQHAYGEFLQYNSTWKENANFSVNPIDYFITMHYNKSNDAKQMI